MARTTKVVNVDLQTVTFSFVNGAKEYRLEQLPADIILRLALHGLSQKLGDAYAALEREEHEAAADAVWYNLKDNNWGASRGAGLEDKLEEAQERLENYIKMSDAEKRTAAALGVTRAGLEKAIKAIEKAIAKRNA